MKQVGVSIGITVAVAIVACGASEQPTTSFGRTVCGMVRPQCCATPISSEDDCNYIVSKLGMGDAAALDACLTELRAAQSDVRFCENPMALSPSCLHAFSPKNAGSTPPGAVCNTSADCTPSEEGFVGCVIANGKSGGHLCSLVLHGRAGDGPCVRTNGPLGPVDGMTEARGFACDATEGLYCDGQKCRPAKPTGADCFGGRYECMATDACIAGKCAPRLAKGATCGAEPFLDPCAEGHKCVGGACIELRPVGAPCSILQECKSSSCVNGTCSPTAPSDYLLGAACLSSRQ